MPFFNIISLGMLALASFSAAAPAIEPSNRAITSVDFEGTVVHYYTDAIHSRRDSRTGLLHKRNDECGTSDFEPAPAPFASVSDCQALASFVYQISGTSWIVSQPGPVSQTIIAWSGTCAFGADTTNPIQTYIGNNDIGDLITSSINALQSGGVVCAQGNMACRNGASFGVSAVFWALYYN